MLQKILPFTKLLLATWLLGLSLSSQADALQDEDTSARFQTTYIWQKKPAFHAPYSGANSLSPGDEKSYSFSATAAFGWRPWQGGELYIDPEVVQGVPLSNLTGLGGMTNGEQQKTSGANPTLYLSRFFLRQTWRLGGEQEAVASDLHQLAGMAAKRRIVLTAGNLAIIDLFGGSAVAHDPRAQFLNWALTTLGAYDFAADARGYTWGAALEYFHDDWVIRAGRFLQPAESNGLALDRRTFVHYGDQVELEHSHALDGLPGKIRLLAFHNRATMGGFRDALADAQNNGGIPAVARVRKERSKFGAGLSIEQQIRTDLTLFASASANDGASETYAFTEIDRALALGAALNGSDWHRDGDTIGIALVANGISAAHRDYLAAGGRGAFLGDGRLNYRPEQIVEAYYSIGISKQNTLSFDLQHIAHPGYNADRGPVTVGSVRLHVEF